MNANAQERAAIILLNCRTLSDADAMLCPLVKSRPMRWGLWDGWAGRQHSLAGLVAWGTPYSEAAKAELDYRQGFEIGVRLAMSELSA